MAVDPISGLGALGSAGALGPVAAPGTAHSLSKTAAPTGKDFKTHLMESLEKVNQLQKEADEGVQKLLSGQTDNVAEVFSATRKAGVAFDLLMEVRNKLMDAYTEIQQMRV